MCSPELIHKIFSLMMVADTVISMQNIHDLWLPQLITSSDTSMLVARYFSTYWNIDC